MNRFTENKTVNVYGTGKRIQNYLDVRDIADIICKGLTTSEFGLFLLSGKNSYSNKDAVNIIKKITNSTSNITYGMHIDPEEDAKWIISSDKAKLKLGFYPQYNFEDSLSWIYQGITS